MFKKDPLEDEICIKLCAIVVVSGNRVATLTFLWNLVPPTITPVLMLLI